MEAGGKAPYNGARNSQSQPPQRKWCPTSEQDNPNPGKDSPAPRKTHRVSRVLRPARESRTTVHTSADNVCVRSKPSTSSSRVSVVPQGTTMRIIGHDGKWTKVAFENGGAGFIHSSLLAQGKGTAAQAAAITPARQECSADSSLIRTALLCRGEQIRPRGDQPRRIRLLRIHQIRFCQVWYRAAALIGCSVSDGDCGVPGRTAGW